MPVAKTGNADLAQIGHVPHSTVNHGSGIAARRHGCAHQAAHSRDVFAILNHHHVNRIGRSLIDRLQHSGEGLGIVVALVFLELDGSGISGEFGRKDRLHAMSHVHALVCYLL